MPKNQGVEINFIDFLKSNSGLEFIRKEDLAMKTARPEEVLIKNMPRKNNLKKVLEKHIADERPQVDFDIEEQLVRENFRIINSERFEFLKTLSRRLEGKKRTWHFSVKRFAKQEISFAKIARLLKAKFLLPELAFSAALVILFFVFVGTIENSAAGNIVKKLNQAIFNIDFPLEKPVIAGNENFAPNSNDELEGQVAGVSETNPDSLELPSLPPLPSAPDIPSDFLLLNKN